MNTFLHLTLEAIGLLLCFAGFTIFLFDSKKFVLAILVFMAGATACSNARSSPIASSRAQGVASNTVASPNVGLNCLSAFQLQQYAL